MKRGEHGCKKPGTSKNEMTGELKKAIQSLPAGKDHLEVLEVEG